MFIDLRDFTFTAPVMLFRPRPVLMSEKTFLIVADLYVIIILVFALDLVRMISKE
jgi:hypothetical protein